jgi:pimeloyl-ACP methyl ester carboxylesterase
MEKHAQNGTSPTSDLSPEAFAIITADQRESIRDGGRAVVFEMKTLCRPWGFSFEDIHIKVYLWHGEADNLAPAMLAHYLAEHIPGCKATFYPGEGHADPLTRYGEDILATVITASEA